MRLRLSVAAVLFAGVLAACTPVPEPAPLAVLAAIPPAPSACHVPPGGRPEELAERGIGGTGGATRPPPPASIRPSLGVAGIIDGFGSVCLNGLEVGLLPGTTVTADGMPAAIGDLRVGQQAVLAAAWADDRPVTMHLRIQHMVVGPIDGTHGTEGLIVAGQTVWLSRTAWIDASLRPGQWVAVSGLRTPSADILASRIDQAAGPEVLVHGRVEGTAAQPRIGRLPVTLSAGSVAIGADVVLRGVERAGRLQVTDLQPDLLVHDPAALFGGQVHRFLIQTLTGSGAQAVAALRLSATMPPGMTGALGALPGLAGFDANAGGVPSGPLSSPSALGRSGLSGPSGRGGSKQGAFPSVEQAASDRASRR